MTWPIPKVLKSDAIVGLIISAMVCAGVLWVRNAGVLQPTEFAVYDSYLHYQSQVSVPEDRILLVAISELDIQKLGSWPLNDGMMAKMLKNLLAHEPRAIGVDIFRNIEVPPGSDELRELFSRDVPVFWVMKFGDKISPGVPGPYMVKDSTRVGFADALVDSGGVTRRGLLFMDDGEESYTSFSLLIASTYLQKDGIGLLPDAANPKLLRIGKTTFALLGTDAGAYVNMDASGHQYLLDFSSIKAGFKSMSLTEVLAGSFPDDMVRDKIVLVGATAESLRDFFFIPITRTAGDGQRVWGVELHASAISQLLRAALDGRKPMRFWSEWQEWSWIVFWALLGYVIGLKVTSFRNFSLLLFLFPAVLAGSTFFLFLQGLWLPVTPPAIAFLLSADGFRLYLLSVEKRQRALLMRLFESHVSKDIAKEIWAQREQFVQNGLPRPQELTATVLFTDLHGYTAISEHLGDPGKLMEWLSEYLDAMTTQVLNNGGIINKYIGDAIMAVFGVPVARETGEEIAEDAHNAIRCAIMMREQLDNLNRKWGEQGRPTVKMRVGIYTGTLVVGCVGSRQRLEYTVIGDTVNVASRLESFDKDLDPGNICRIIVGHSTWAYAGNRFRFRDLGVAALKGKGQRINIYQVLGPLEEEDQESRRDDISDEPGVSK